MPAKQELENMVIRDPTEDELEFFKEKVEEEVRAMNKEQSKMEKDYSRCSLIESTPRGENVDFDSAQDSARSNGIQLTGIKPKALEFFSPMKSPAPGKIL
jgi:hypothetical protein